MWIKCSEALPVDGKVVFTAHKNTLAVGFLADGEWFFPHYPIMRMLPIPTHWSFLPKPPASDENWTYVSLNCKSANALD